MHTCLHNHRRTFSLEITQSVANLRAHNCVRVENAADRFAVFTRRHDTLGQDADAAGTRSHGTLDDHVIFDIHPTTHKLITALKCAWAVHDKMVVPDFKYIEFGPKT